MVIWAHQLQDGEHGEDYKPTPKWPKRSYSDSENNNEQRFMPGPTPPAKVVFISSMTATFPRNIARQSQIFRPCPLTIWNMPSPVYSHADTGGGAHSNRSRYASQGCSPLVIMWDQVRGFHSAELSFRSIFRHKGKVSPGAYKTAQAQKKSWQKASVRLGHLI